MAVNHGCWDRRKGHAAGNRNWHVEGKARSMQNNPNTEALTPRYSTGVNTSTAKHLKERCSITAVLQHGREADACGPCFHTSATLNTACCTISHSHLSTYHVRMDLCTYQHYESSKCVKYTEIILSLIQWISALSAPLLPITTGELGSPPHQLSRDDTT